MVYRKRRWNKRRGKRKRKSRYNSKALNRTGTVATFQKGPLPTTLKTKLRYTEQYVMNPGIGTTGVYVFRANCVYDPNKTAGGHQARGFDEIMPLYNHFTVIGSKMTTQIINSSGISIVAGVTLVDDTTTSADANTYMENQRSVWNVHSLANPNKTITMSCNPQKFLGRSHALSDPQLKGTVSASPDEQAFYQVWAAASDGASDPGQIHLITTIDYIVVFSEPNQPLQS